MQLKGARIILFSKNIIFTNLNVVIDIIDGKNDIFLYCYQNLLNQVKHQFLRAHIADLKSIVVTDFLDILSKEHLYAQSRIIFGICIKKCTFGFSRPNNFIGISFIKLFYKMLYADQIKFNRS